jgi:hypothetical protein
MLRARAKNQKHVILKTLLAYRTIQKQKNLLLSKGDELEAEAEKTRARLCSEGMLQGLKQDRISS